MGGRLPCLSHFSTSTRMSKQKAFSITNRNDRDALGVPSEKTPGFPCATLSPAHRPSTSRVPHFGPSSSDSLEIPKNRILVSSSAHMKGDLFGTRPGPDVIIASTCHVDIRTFSLTVRKTSRYLVAMNFPVQWRLLVQGTDISSDLGTFNKQTGAFMVEENIYTHDAIREVAKQYGRIREAVPDRFDRMGLVG